MQSCKVMIISTKFPFPADDGKKVVLSGLVRYFVDRFGADRVRYVAVNDRSGVAARPDDFPCGLTWMPPPRAGEQAMGVLGSITRRSQRSLQEAITHSARLRSALQQVVEEAGPDLLILDTIRMGQYFVDGPRPARRTILYMDHLLYTRFRAMSRFAAAHPDAALDPVGTFRRFVPKLVRRMLRAALLQRWLFKVEAKAVEPREVESANAFDACLLLTGSDVDELHGRCPDRDIRAIKPVLFSRPCETPRRYDGSARFLVCGSLRHPANRAALVQFFRHGLAPAIAQIPALDIRIVGAGADDELRALAAPFDGHVRFEGYVDDLGAQFASACALLVPLQFGYGLKIKMLAAMYYGLPAISTSEGARGLPLRPGHDFILEDDLTRFPAWMQRLRDVDYNDAVSQRARATYRRNFSREVVYAEYDHVFAA